MWAVGCSFLAYFLSLISFDFISSPVVLRYNAFEYKSSLIHMVILEVLHLRPFRVAVAVAEAVAVDAGMRGAARGPPSCKITLAAAAAAAAAEADETAAQ